MSKMSMKCRACNKLGLRVRSGKVEGHCVRTKFKTYVLCNGSGQAPRIQKMLIRAKRPTVDVLVADIYARLILSEREEFVGEVWKSSRLGDSAVFELVTARGEHVRTYATLAKLEKALKKRTKARHHLGRATASVFLKKVKTNRHLGKASSKNGDRR